MGNYRGDCVSDDTAELATLVNLKRLHLTHGSIPCLKTIGALDKLERLALHFLSYLQSLDGIEELGQSLEFLDINTCKKIRSIEPVSALRNLKVLNLDNCGEIDSLKPIQGMDKLQVVSFIEITRIMDGDMTPLMGLPALRSVGYMNRKTYTHTREQICEITGAMGPRPPDLIW